MLVTAFVGAGRPFLLDFYFLLTEDPETAHTLTEKTLESAFARLESLPVGVDVRVWLARQAVVRYRSERRRERWRRWWHRLRGEGLSDKPQGQAPPADSSDGLRPAVAALTDAHRVLIGLVFALGFPVEDAARILRTRPAHVRRQLDHACQFLIEYLAAAEGTAASAEMESDAAHRKVRYRLQDSLTGARDPVVAEHLPTCPACAGHARELRKLHTAVRDLSPDRSETDDDRSAFIERLMSKHPGGGPGILKLTRELTWTLIAIGVILAAGWTYNRLNGRYLLAFPEIDRRASALPTPIEVDQSARERVTARGVSAPDREERPPVNYLPALSADGRWVAFVSTAEDLVPGDDNRMADIFVYDRQTDAIELVSVSSEGEQAERDSYAPIISGDGRRVVFFSFATNLAPEVDLVCPDRAYYAAECLLPYLHDRVAGTTRFIRIPVRELEGRVRVQPAAISGDGRWLAVWEVEEQSPTALAPPGDSVVDGPGSAVLWLNDLETGEWIRVHRLDAGPDGQVGTGRAVLSQDGRWIAFAGYGVYPGNPEPGWEVMVFDRLDGEKTAVDQSELGDPGDGLIYGFDLSADGRFLAFASDSNNLATDDDNDLPDVFVRDVETGDLEWVSAGEGGRQGNAESGALAGERMGGYGIRLLQIRGDGQGVMFYSKATNLIPDQEDLCRGIPDCVHWFYYDRAEERLIQIENLPITPFSNLEMSANGRWIVYDGFAAGCQFADYCLDIFIYDRLEQVRKRLLPVGPGILAGEEKSGRWNANALLQEDQTRITSLAFSPEGSMLAGGDLRGVVRVWPVGSTEPRWTFEAEGGRLNGADFSPDGSTLAIASGQRVYLLHADNGRLNGVITGLPGFVMDVAYSPEGSLLAAASLREVRIWDTTEGFIEQQWEYPGSYANEVVFSPDGELVAVAAGDQTVWVHRVRDGEVLLRLGNHEGKVIEVAFSSDGRFLATGSQDGTANVWELDLPTRGAPSAELTSTLEYEDWVTGVTFMPGGDLVVGTFEGRLDRWVREPASSGYRAVEESLARAPNQVAALTLSGDGSLLAASSNYGTVTIWRWVP